MMEENNAAEPTAADDPVTADEIARAEIAKERAAAAAPAVENLQGIGDDAQVSEEQQHAADLAAVLQQSVEGRGLSQRQINHARQAGLEFERIDPHAAKAWATWAEQSADHMGWVVSRLANGELPSGPPSRHSDQISGLDNKWRAQRELDALVKANPPGSRGYIEHQARIQALYTYIDGGTPLVGQSLRRV